MAMLRFAAKFVSHLMRMSVPAVTTALRPFGLRMACMLVTLDEEG